MLTKAQATKLLTEWHLAENVAAAYASLARQAQSDSTKYIAGITQMEANMLLEDILSKMRINDSLHL